MGKISTGGQKRLILILKAQTIIPQPNGKAEAKLGSMGSNVFYIEWGRFQGLSAKQKAFLEVSPYLTFGGLFWERVSVGEEE